jgi:inulin fructotransferase (DFA-I-forming)
MVLLDSSSENLVGSNHLLRDHEPWTPFSGIDNGQDDLAGLVRITGDDNSVIGNHFSEAIDARAVRPAGARPVIIRLAGGSGNHVMSNHTVALDVRSDSSDSAFAAQVDALLATGSSEALAVTTVRVDAESERNTILDSGTDAEVVLDRGRNAFRATPSL